jgi:transmembrane 9 superfamily protein 2/4
MLNLQKALSTVGCIFLLVCTGANAADGPPKKVGPPKKGRFGKKPIPKGKTQRIGALADRQKLREKTAAKLDLQKRLNGREKKEVATVELAAYKAKRKDGGDEVTNTEEAVLLRNYRLRSKKKTGVLRRRETSLSQILFPGVSPEEYKQSEKVWIYADLVDSKKTQVPYEFYDLPGCPYIKETEDKKRRRERKNLGARLQGHDMKPAPFSLYTKRDKPCTPMCRFNLNGKKLRWTKFLIERQYRVQLQLDGLPVLMRSSELNYAVRGYPVGFRAPANTENATPSGNKKRKKRFDDGLSVFLYNHLKFTITYHEDIEMFEGIRITGFDVHPVSISHTIPDSGSEVTEKTDDIATCTGMDVANDSRTYLSLSFENGNSVDVIYSYDITWEANEYLLWADRWDVYLVGAPDDDIHYYSIVNSLMIVLFMTGAIATIMIRTLRKDIAGYNELQTLEEAKEESGWKLVHGDVFRPPQYSPMMLSVMVGTGCQIGVAFGLTMLLAMFNITNSMRKGQVLTSMILLYVLCGSIAGYMSARIYKFCGASNWKLNTIATATALPGVFVGMFIVLNTVLKFVGAATAVNFLTIIALLLLWVTISTPMVFVGAFIGLKAKAIEVPTKTKQIARIVPDSPWHMNPGLTVLMGGILPFGSVCIELAFIMSALWLHQIYYVMGFLFAVLLILGATCAQVSIVLCYLHLCAEDHRWWWKSFMNCAMSGFYLFLYSLWFLSSRLDLIGILPVTVYLTYMSMISVCFGLFCGSVGFISSLWFVRTIYGAVKVD